MKWTRRVEPAADLGDFLVNYRIGMHDDPPGEPTDPAWLAPGAPCRGDGWDAHGLLFAPRDHGRPRCLISGEIVDGRGRGAVNYRRDG